MFLYSQLLSKKTKCFWFRKTIFRNFSDFFFRFFSESTLLRGIENYWWSISDLDLGVSFFPRFSNAINTVYHMHSFISCFLNEFDPFRQFRAVGAAHTALGRERSLTGEKGVSLHSWNSSVFLIVRKIENNRNYSSTLRLVFARVVQSTTVPDSGPCQFLY